MAFNRFILSFGILLVLFLSLAGCGGGGSATESQGSQPAKAASVVAWDPPTTYVDNSMMDPYRDLDYYEFYVGSSPNFTDNDVPIAQVAAVTNILGSDGNSYNTTLTNEFILGNLKPFAMPGKVNYLSIRAVGVGGLKSDFSEPVLWDLS